MDNNREVKGPLGEQGLTEALRLVNEYMALESNTPKEMSETEYRELQQAKRDLVSQLAKIRDPLVQVLASRLLTDRSAGRCRPIIDKLATLVLHECG